MISRRLVETLRELAQQATQASAAAPLPGLDEFCRHVAAAFGFDPGGSIYISSSPSGYGLSRVSAIGHGLVARARNQDAGKVLDEFARLVETNQTELLQVIVLWGVHSESEIELPRGIRLMPLASVPPSSMRAHFLGSHGAEERRSARMPAVVAKPRAALVRPWIYGPVFGSVREFETPAVMKIGQRWGASEEEMLDVARMLTVILRRPIFPVASGFQHGQMWPFGGGGWGGQAIHWTFQQEHQPETLDATFIEQRGQAYLAVESRLRPGLQTAIERLRAARIDTSYRERALNLGIALEAALFAGGGSDVGELTYRFTVRGTVLRGGSALQRRETATLLKQVYRLRGKVAHGGRAPEDDDVAGAEQAIVQKGIQLCGDVIDALVTRRSVPDWDGLVLGWSEESSGHAETVDPNAM